MTDGQAATYQDALREGTEILNRAGRDNAGRDVRMLMCGAAEMSSAALIAASTEQVDHEILKAYWALIARRAAGEPVQRILGRAEFYGLTFELSDETLVPRPDTEILIDKVIEVIGERPARVLDIGTGSGAIAIAVSANCKLAEVSGTDISPKAVATAKQNAARHGLGDRIRFVVGDLFPSGVAEFDIIFSNPPYIRTRDLEGLMEEVRAHDPRLALDGGPDGLEVYRRIFSAAPGHLSGQGQVFVELGIGQSQSVTGIGRDTGLQLAGIYRDMAGIERVAHFVKS